MATCEEFLKWYDRDMGSWGERGTHAIERCSGGSSEGLTEVTLDIFTDTNRYRLRAVNARPETGTQQAHGAYLGCTASSRKARAGEDWERGNDLPDGPLTEETWHRILAAIVSFELVRVHRREDAVSQPAAVSSGDALQNQSALAAAMPGTTIQ